MGLLFIELTITDRFCRLGESLSSVEQLLMSPPGSNNKFQTPGHTDGSDSLDLYTKQKSHEYGQKGPVGDKRKLMVMGWKQRIINR